ncbi:MAG: hypothetical protein ACREMA_07705, partial [Longimicrobiales bacterium]
MPSFGYETRYYYGTAAELKAFNPDCSQASSATTNIAVANVPTWYFVGLGERWFGARPIPFANNLPVPRRPSDLFVSYVMGLGPNFQNKAIIRRNLTPAPGSTLRVDFSNPEAFFLGTRNLNVDIADVAFIDVEYRTANGTVAPICYMDLG